MKINKPLIKKMIAHYEEVPESFSQDDYGHRHGKYDERPKPICGTVACLAGTAIICSTPTLKGGVAKLFRLISQGPSYTKIDETAGDLMSIPLDQAGDLFLGGADGWPEKYPGRN